MPSPEECEGAGAGVREKSWGVGGYAPGGQGHGSAKASGTTFQSHCPWSLMTFWGAQNIEKCPATQITCKSRMHRRPQRLIRRTATVRLQKDKERSHCAESNSQRLRNCGKIADYFSKLGTSIPRPQVPDPVLGMTLPRPRGTTGVQCNVQNNDLLWSVMRGRQPQSQHGVWGDCTCGRERSRWCA